MNREKVLNVVNTLIDNIMEEITKEFLTKMEDRILEELAEIKRYTLLGAKNVLTMEDVALLTGVTTGYIYKLTCGRKIPFYKPNGKMLYFDRKEIEAWMRQNRVATNDELESQAITYLTTGRK